MNDFRLPKIKSIAKNSNQEDKILSLLPRLPIVSSTNSGWKTLQLACCHEPAFKIPEHKSKYHGICINGGKVVRLEQKIEGKVKIRLNPIALPNSFLKTGRAFFSAPLIH